MKLRTTLPVAAVVLLLTAACSSGAAEPPGLTASPTVSSPSPEPSPTPDADGILEQSQPELGIVLEDPPALTGVEADVYDGVALYMKAYWTTMTTNEASPMFELLASPELQEAMRAMAARNAGNALDIGGTYRVRITDVTVTGEGEATAAVCSDYRETTFADPDGQYTPAEVDMGEPAGTAFTLSHLGGAWRVQTSEGTGPC